MGSLLKLSLLMSLAAVIAVNPNAAAGEPKMHYIFMCVKIKQATASLRSITRAQPPLLRIIFSFFAYCLWYFLHTPADCGI